MRDLKKKILTFLYLSVRFCVMKKLNPKLYVLFIVVAGVLLRLIYIIEIRKSPFFYSPFGDPQFFDKWAFEIARGDVIGKEVFFKAPLYPYILALFYKAAGYNLLIPRLLNILFDGISIFVLFLIGKKLFNNAVGLIAAIIGSIFGPLIYFSGEILGTSLAVLLSLTFFYLLLIVDKRIWMWFIAGFVLSLAVLVRPNLLMLIPVIIACIYLLKTTLLTKVKSSLVFLVGVLILLSFTGIRNYIIGKDIVMVNYSGGINFYIGNNLESDGVSAVLPAYGNDWDEYSIAEIELERELKPSEVSHFWLMKGLGFIGDYPFRSLLLFIRKSYLLLNGKEISNNQNIYRYVKDSSIMRFLLFISGSKRLYFAFPSSIVISLALSGILLSLKTRRFLLPYLIIISCGFSVVIFFVSSRYRMPLLTFIIPFSAYSIYWILMSVREKRKIFIWFISFMPFLFLSNYDPYRISMENNALEFYNLGNVFLNRGELDKAEEYYKKGIKSDFYFPRLHLNLGAVYYMKDDPKGAEEEYQTEIRINPLEAKTYHNLAVLLEKEGKAKDAILYERQAIERMPRFAEAYVNVGRLYVKVEKYDSAEAFLEKANRLKKNDKKILSLLGLVNIKQKRFERAIVFYRKAIELMDNSAVSYYNLAVAYIALGDLRAAREHLQSAIYLDRDFAAAHYNLGMIYLEEGDVVKAEEEFKEALRIQPDFLEAKKMIEKIR